MAIQGRIGKGLPIRHVSGVSNVVKNIRKAQKAHERGVAIGLIRAGLFAQRKSQQVVPVDTGNLKGSAFTRAEGQGFNTDVHVGYTASYAIYVHERLDLRHKPGKQAKYLSQPVEQHKDEIVKIVVDSALKAFKAAQFNT